MKNIKEILKAVDEKLNREKPNTMDDFISCIHTVPGMESYGSHYAIVKHMGYLQGVRVYITGRKISHPLPAKNKVYSVFKGLEKYEAAGWTIEND